jgi:hypothetical protein
MGMGDYILQIIEQNENKEDAWNALRNKEILQECEEDRELFEEMFAGVWEEE